MQYDKLILQLQLIMIDHELARVFEIVLRIRIPGPFMFIYSKLNAVITAVTFLLRMAKQTNSTQQNTPSTPEIGSTSPVLLPRLGNASGPN